MGRPEEKMAKKKLYGQKLEKQRSLIFKFKCFSTLQCDHPLLSTNLE